MTPTAATLEDAYRDYRGLLFAALGRLAREGFAVPPSDALDLVHDFFAEAWSGLAERFDPAQAALQTYLYAAFVRFARPRIVRLQRQYATLLDPADLARMVDEADEDSEPGDQLERRRVGMAIGELQGDDRTLIQAWLEGNDRSERDTARQLGLSRYEVRRRLIEALGKLSAGVGALEGRSALDKAIALAVWRDHLTIDEAAARAGVTVQQARNAYRRNQRRISDSLSFGPPARTPTL